MPSGCLPGYGGLAAYRLIEHLQPELELGFCRCEGRSHPERPAHPRQLHDVHVQPEFEAATGDRGAQVVRRFLVLPVED